MKTRAHSKSEESVEPKINQRKEKEFLKGKDTSKTQRCNCTEVSKCCGSGTLWQKRGPELLKPVKITNPNRQETFVSYYQEIFCQLGRYCLEGFDSLSSQKRKNSPGKGPCSLYTYAPTQLHFVFELVTTTTVTTLHLLLLCDFFSFSPYTHVKTFVLIKWLSCYCHRRRIQQKVLNLVATFSILLQCYIKKSINSEQV